MAKIKLTGHASGTGVLTVTAPNTSTDRTITLPVKAPPANGSLFVTSLLTASVSVASGNVIVLSVLVFGAVTVTTPVPDACPVIFTLAIYISYAIIQVLPVGMVTDTPLLIVTAPALKALLPLVIL